MTRKKVLALAGMLALGSLPVATGAMARGGGGGGGGGGGHMGGGGGGMGMGHGMGRAGGVSMGMGHVGGAGMGHWSGGMGHWNGGVGRWGGVGWHGHVGHFHPFFNHRRFFAFGFGSYYGYPYDDYYDDSSYGDDCWQWRHVHTHWGWRWRQINVCGYSY